MSESTSAGGDGPSGGTDGPAEPASRSGAYGGVSRRGFLRAGALGTAAAAGATAAAGTAAAQAYGGWLSDVSNYEATLDYRGQDTVTVEVGVGEQGLLFGPPAILVDPGTTVVWEWTGAGGGHNVVHQPEGDGEPAFETQITDQGGFTFEHQFDAEGTYRYYCAPHQPLGMKGVVAVGSTDDTVVAPGGDGGNGDGGGGFTASDVAVLGGAVALVVALVLTVVLNAEPPSGATR